MSTPAYGNAYHRLRDSSTAFTIAPVEADGSAYEGTIFVSPKVTDIRLSVGGEIVKFWGTDGTMEGFDISKEEVQVTLTVLPSGSTKANALKGVHVYRKGTPFTFANAPVIELRGHTEEGSPVIADLLTGTALFFLESDDRQMSLEGETTGTMTFFRKVGGSAIAATPIA